MYVLKTAYNFKLYFHVATVLLMFSVKTQHHLSKADVCEPQSVV